MAKEYVTARNTLTGKVGRVRPDVLSHPVFGKSLVEVPAGSKSYVSELYKPRTVEEFKVDHPEKEVTEEAETPEKEDN